MIPVLVAVARNTRSVADDEDEIDSYYMGKYSSTASKLSNVR